MKRVVELRGAKETKIHLQDEISQAGAARAGVQEYLLLEAERSVRLTSEGCSLY